MKNKWLGVLATTLLAGALLLSGCGEGSSSDSKESTKELSIAAWGYDANPEFKAMVEAFKGKHPDVSFKIVDIDASKYEDKVTTMLASGDTTDVLAIKGVGSYVNYAQKGQLLDLSEEVAALPDKDNFKGNLEGYHLDGKYYAMPFRKDIYMLFYNKTLFDEANESYPQNLTWDEYEALAKKLAHDKDGQRIYGSYHHTWYPILLSTAANQTGHELLDGKYSYLTDYLDRWVRMQDNKTSLDYSTIKTTGVTYASQFEGAKTAMMPMGSFYLGKLIDAKKNGRTDVNWGVTSLPQNEKGQVTTYGGPTGFAVNKHTKNEKLAREFVAFCSGAEGAKAVAGIGMTPAYQSDEVLDILYNLEGMPQDEESKKALRPDKNGWEMKPDETTAAINEIVNEEYDLMMVGDSTVKEGIKAMDKRVQEVKAEQ